MKLEAQHRYEKVILGIELAGFSIIWAILWLDEYADVPFRFLGAPKTPLRPQEFWFEAITALLVGAAVVASTLWVFRRLRALESFIQICAWCRKINVQGDWVAFEQYLKREHDLHSSHGICPDCRESASRRPALVESEVAS